jgi:hypothetical protein
MCDIAAPACTPTTSCVGGAVCVEGHCVAPCTTTDAGPLCPGGLICVNGGCIPDEAAVPASSQNDGG